MGSRTYTFNDEDGKRIIRKLHKTDGRYWISFKGAYFEVVNGMEMFPWVEDVVSSGSLALFKDLIDDAPNWSGQPLFGGNVGGSQESKGHLTDLKKKGLVETWVDDEDRSLSWVCFTAKGRRFAATIGYEAEEIDALGG